MSTVDDPGPPPPPPPPPAHSARRRRMAGRRPLALRVLGSSWLLGSLLTLTAMPLWVRSPSTGLDPSWQAAMHMAARSGLHFGSGIDFTYGPLGFLVVPSLYYPSTGVLAGLCTLALRVVTVVAVLWSARRSLGLVLGLACAYLAAHALLYVDPPQVIPPLLLLGTLVVLGREDRDRLRWLPAAAGVAAGFLLLVKFNVGLAAIGLGLVTAWCAGRGRWRGEAAMAGALAVTLLGGWLATGNRLGDLPGWWSSSLQIASGYSTAMALETTRSGDPLLVLLALAAVGVAVWLGTRGWPGTTRVAAAVGLAGVLFVAFKHGFVRHDGHVVSFFGVLPVVVLSFRMDRRWLLPLFAAAVAALVVANPFPNEELWNPSRSFDKAATFAGDMTSPARLRRTIAASREGQRSVLGIDGPTLAALAGQTVHIDPWETTAAWAYPELHWRPLPVFQSYSAYTAALDRRNAKALLSAGGPSRILRQTPRSVDSRDADFETPLATRAMLCNFEELFTAGEWQVLGRAADRCGRPEPQGTVTVRRGQWVDVPAPAGGPALVMARLKGVEGPAIGKLVALLYKSPETVMEVDDGTTFRIVPETAAGPLLMAAPPELGYSAPFGFARHIRRFRLLQRHDLGIDRFDRVTVEFVRIPLAPAAGSRP